MKDESLHSTTSQGLHLLKGMMDGWSASFTVPHLNLQRWWWIACRRTKSHTVNVLNVWVEILARHLFDMVQSDHTGVPILKTIKWTKLLLFWIILESKVKAFKSNTTNKQQSEKQALKKCKLILLFYLFALFWLLFYLIILILWQKAPACVLLSIVSLFLLLYKCQQKAISWRDTL